MSMGFAEALSDEGSLTGRGHRWARGVCHTLPFLVHDFCAAMGAAVMAVVELAAISWIRHRFMDTPIWWAALQVGLGRALVFLTGVLIGRS